MLVDTGLSSKRFHTCIFNQDYISQRSVTAHKCSHPFLLEMYQLQASTLNQFFFVPFWTQGACFSYREKNNLLEFHRTLMPTVFISSIQQFSSGALFHIILTTQLPVQTFGFNTFAYSKFDNLHKFWVAFNPTLFSNS